MSSQCNPGKSSWPALIAVTVLWITVAVCLVLSLRANQGNLVYALDDPYIHMAMAKHFINCGVWATNGTSFSSSSSSPLWTGLLTVCYMLTGVNEIAPFILNLIFASLLVILISLTLRQWQIFGSANLLCLLCLIYITPLPALIFSGMEHTLHILLTILFCLLVCRVLSEGDEPIDLRILFPLGAAVVMSRYEGLFLILVSAFLFALKKRFRDSLLLIGISLTPLVAYGLLSVYHGNDFLPNSVLTKGHFPHSLDAQSILGFVHEGMSRVSTSHMLSLLVACLFLFIMQSSSGKQSWTRERILVAIFVSVALLHLLFADVGWFYRYEAYLVALGILVMFILGSAWYGAKADAKMPAIRNPKPLAVAVLISIISAPLMLRAIDSLWEIPGASHSIYAQQYQMGQFLKRYYVGQNIAVNDLGAVSYFADVNCLDLWGLGSIEVARAMRNGCYNSQVMEELLRLNNIQIAIVYESWFSKRDLLPPSWVKAGQWRTLRPNVVSFDTVSFYAVDNGVLKDLITNLRDFGKSLPSDVEQKGLYVEGSRELPM